MLGSGNSTGSKWEGSNVTLLLNGISDFCLDAQSHAACSVATTSQVGVGGPSVNLYVQSP